jgi:hypothetical protein
MFAISPSSTTWSTTSGSATAIVVNLPYSTSDIQLLTTFIDTTSFVATDIKEILGATANTISGTLTTATNTYAYGTNQITISTIGQVPATTKYLIFDVGSSGSDVALPYVTSNKATFYETWVTATTSSTVDIYNTMISVFTKDAGTDMISTPLCTDVVLGIPLYSLFTALDMDIAFGTTYALEITVTGASGLVNTGVVDGETIPYDGGVTGATVTYKAGVLTIMGFGTISATDTVKTYILWDNSWATATDPYTVTTRLYYTVSTNAEQYVLYSKTDDWTATAITGAATSAFTT